MFLDIMRVRHSVGFTIVGNFLASAQQLEGHAEVVQAKGCFSLADGNQGFLDRGQDSQSESLRPGIVDVGIFGQVIDRLRTEKALMRHGAVFPVVVTENFGGIAHLELVVGQTVDKILVFAVMVE